MRLFPIALVIVLAWGALAIGGAPDWAAAPVLVLSLTAGILGFLERRASSDPAHSQPLAMMLGLALLVSCVGLQLIPLTPQVVARVSPAHDIANFDSLRAIVNYRDPATLPAVAGNPTKALSIAPGRTAVGLGALLGFGVLLFGTARALSIVSLRRIVIALMLLGLVVSFVRFWRVADPVSPIYGLYVPLTDLHHSAPFTNHNHLAGWLVMVLSLTLGLLAAQVSRGLRGVAPNWRERLLWFASKEASHAVLTLCVVAVLAICVLVSQSRSGATIMAAVFVMFIGLTLRKDRLPIGRRALAIGLGVLLLGVFWVAGSGFSKRLAGTEWARLDGRVAVWQDTLRIFNDFPLTGTGFNTYAIAMLHYQTVDDGLRYQEAHNEYLQLLSDGGALVAVPMLVFVVASIITVRRRFREQADDTQTYWIRVGAVAGIIAIALQSLLDFTLQTPGGAVMFAALLAIAIHSPRRRSSQGGSLLSILVIVTGVAVAVWSGVAAYRANGLYGGPLYPGFYRQWDPAIKRYVLYHETTGKDGLRVRRRFEERLKLVETQMSGGKSDLPLAVSISADQKTIRAGFSTANDGVIDAWSAVDPKTGAMRVEISTKRNDRIDRWERYEKGVLVRVDLDTNGNGKPDRWMTYEDGIQMDTFIDANEDGKADAPN